MKMDSSGFSCDVFRVFGKMLTSFFFFFFFFFLAKHIIVGRLFRNIHPSLQYSSHSRIHTSLYDLFPSRVHPALWLFTLVTVCTIFVFMCSLMLSRSVEAKTKTRKCSFMLSRSVEEKNKTRKCLIFEALYLNLEDLKQNQSNGRKGKKDRESHTPFTKSLLGTSVTPGTESDFWPTMSVLVNDKQ